MKKDYNDENKALRRKIKELRDHAADYQKQACELEKTEEFRPPPGEWTFLEEADIPKVRCNRCEQMVSQLAISVSGPDHPEKGSCVPCTQEILAGIPMNSAAQQAPHATRGKPTFYCQGEED